MPGKCRPSLREKTLANVMRSNLSETDKACIKAVFERYDAHCGELYEKPPKQEVNLDGKCGSCEHSVIAVGAFGNSKCYVECTSREHLSERQYYGRPLVAVRQRTAKACKYYRRKENEMPV